MIMKIVQGVSNTTIGFVLALPYGVAADRIGRRPVLILAFAGAFVQALLTRLIGTVYNMNWGCTD